MAETLNKEQQDVLEKIESVWIIYEINCLLFLIFLCLWLR